MLIELWLSQSTSGRWIGSGFEVDYNQKWSNHVAISHSLIKARACRRYQAVVGLYKKQTCCMYRDQTVFKASQIGYPETWLFTSEWQVYGADTIEVNWSNFHTMWVEVWDWCEFNVDQVQTGLICPPRKWTRPWYPTDENMKLLQSTLYTKLNSS